MVSFELENVDKGSPDFKDCETTINLGFSGLEAYWKPQSIVNLLEFINKQDEPFDGICGFSQGVYTLKTFIKTMRYFKKNMWVRHRMPFFVVDFNGPAWEYITFEFLGSEFVSGETFITQMESIHFISDKDEYAKALKPWREFEAPTVIKHD